MLHNYFQKINPSFKFHVFDQVGTLTRKIYTTDIQNKTVFKNIFLLRFV